MCFGIPYSLLKINIQQYYTDKFNYRWCIWDS